MPIATMELKVVPRESFADHIFRFYEPQSTKTYLKLPKFAPFALQGMVVKTSNQTMVADVN